MVSSQRLQSPMVKDGVRIEVGLGVKRRLVACT